LNTDIHHPKSYSDQTIFCEKEGRKKVKVKGSWTTEGTVRFEYDGGVTVQRMHRKSMTSIYSLKALLSVTLSLFGIFIFTFPFLRVLAVLISARWMVLKLAETEFSTPNYRSENLKVNLEKTYGKKIMF
jgi:hypothetical protein